MVGPERAAAAAPRAAYVEQVMGLPVSIHVRGPRARSDTTAVLVDGAFAELRRADELFSTYRSDSQVSLIDHDLLDVADADPWVVDVLRLAEVAEALTQGLFCVRLPRADGTASLDPSGIVKGWAAERAFQVLQSLDEHDVCLNAGGDVVVATAGGGAPWRVGVERPGEPGLLGVIERSSGAVATSGTGARGAHLVDPRDGSVPDTLTSMTVVGPSLTWADVLATAAFVRGADAVRWLGRFPGYTGVSVARTGRVTVSEGLSLLPL